MTAPQPRTPDLSARIAREGVGAPVPDQALALRVEPASGLAPSGFDPSRAVEGEVMRPESCDAEVAEMMERLSRLQTWLTMQCCQRNGDPMFRAAMGLIQDVRVLLVERCFK